MIIESLEKNELVDVEGDILERTGADRDVFLDRIDIGVIALQQVVDDRFPYMLGDQVQLGQRAGLESRRRRMQRETQRQVVDDLDIGDVAREGMIIGRFRTELFVAILVHLRRASQRRFEGVGGVIGLHILAIMPLHARAQGDDHIQRVFPDDALGRPRLRHANRVDAHQAVPSHLGNAARRIA